jgi:hypothetical protein
MKTSAPMLFRPINDIIINLLGAINKRERGVAGVAIPWKAVAKSDSADFQSNSR